MCKRVIADSNAATLDSSITIIASLSLGIYNKYKTQKGYKTYGSQQRQKKPQNGEQKQQIQMGQAEIKIYKRVQNKWFSKTKTKITYKGSQNKDKKFCQQKKHKQKVHTALWAVPPLKATKS